MQVITVLATKPRGRLAALLIDAGLSIAPIEKDKGNVDRYILSKRLVVERRTASSFLGGIVDKTLFTSAIYVRENFDLPVLIVEGEIDYERTAFSPQAVRGALSSMILSYGLSVLSTPDVEETAHLIALMARQEQAGIPEISLVPKRKAASLDDVQRRIIEMLPGCGRVTARDLLQCFGSVERITHATRTELLGVRGIGAKKAAEMHRALHAEYESIDTERNLEDAIEAAPELLFSQPIVLLARQHHIHANAPASGQTDDRARGRERMIVDLVYQDPAADELILVELKRGRLVKEHCDQILRYLDHARESELLRGHLDRGTQIRGVVATVQGGGPEAGEALARAGEKHRLAIHVIDEQRALRVLRQLRQRRLERLSAARPHENA